MTENLRKAVWAKGRKTEMNVTLAFRLVFPSRMACEMTVLGETCYKVLVDGEVVFFGPNRAAHGYSRLSRVDFTGQTVVVESYASNVENYDRRKQSPFFACEIRTADGKKYSADDFECFRLTDRVQKVQRYSYQRGFLESYRQACDRTALYRGESVVYPREEVERAELPKILPSRTENPILQAVSPLRRIDEGECFVNDALPVWEDRSIDLVGSVLEGFVKEEWEDSVSDSYSKFVFASLQGKESSFQGGRYATTYETWDFGRIFAGFSELVIEAEEEGDVYAAFDEILSEKTGDVDPFRGGTANVFRWRIEKKGRYRVSTFDVYAYRYIKIVCSRGIRVKQIALRRYENPDADGFRIECENKAVLSLFEGARATFRHNAVDILTDCPSRERAGWLSDSYFTSEAEQIFTGENKAERAFLENFLYADKSGFPSGMIPRCYPSDNNEPDRFIPNWAMWYVLELYKYSLRYGHDEIVERSKENVVGILRYFSGKENEFGVLEDLDGWVFVEWSAANWDTHLRGVNVPSNACYYATLQAAAKLYGEEEETLLWRKRAEKVKAFLLENAYTGEFFVDNLVRQEGKLVPSDCYTEVCQYYMFWFGCADKETYASLFSKMLTRYGGARIKEKAEIVVNGKALPFERANMMYGVYMRLDLLMREGKRKKLFEECVRYFSEMTEKTGTLWEKNDPVASCDHGFASYVALWLLYALTGYDGLNGNSESDEGIGIDCKINMPKGRGMVEITVKNNVVTVEEK